MNEICQVDKESTLIMYCCMHAVCGKCYSTKFNLKRHIETIHLRIKKYQCKDCKKLFSSKQNLTEHMYTHSGARPFSCKICKKIFRQASQLSLHKRAHIYKMKPESLSDSVADLNSSERLLDSLNNKQKSKLDVSFLQLSRDSKILLLPKLRETTKYEPFMNNLPSIF